MPLYAEKYAICRFFAKYMIAYLHITSIPNQTGLKSKVEANNDISPLTLLTLLDPKAQHCLKASHCGSL